MNSVLGAGIACLSVGCRTGEAGPPATGGAKRDVWEGHRDSFTLDRLTIEHSIQACPKQDDLRAGESWPRKRIRQPVRWCACATAHDALSSRTDLASQDCRRTSMAPGLLPEESCSDTIQ